MWPWPPTSLRRPHVHVEVRHTSVAQQAADSVTFGSVPMRLIKPSHVEQWVKDMSTRLAGSTIRTRYNYVHMAFRAAERATVSSRSNRRRASGCRSCAERTRR